MRYKIKEIFGIPGDLYTKHSDRIYFFKRGRIISKVLTLIVPAAYDINSEGKGIAIQ